MTTRIQLRRGTAAQWAAANPTLAEGEMGVELPEMTFKMGDGIAPWNDLPYASGTQGPTGPTGATGAGVPAGGGIGQFLAKASTDDYDTTWQSAEASFPLEMPAQTDPAGGTGVKLYAAEFAGRLLPAVRGPVGQPAGLQLALNTRRIFLVTLGSSTTLNVQGGALTSVGTISHTVPATVGSTVFPYLANQVTASSTSATAGTGMSALQIRAGGDGFYYVARLAFPDASYNETGASTGSRFFCGVTDGSLALSVASDNPSGNLAGFFRSHVNGGLQHSTFQVATKDGTTLSLVDTTMTFTPQNVYDFYIYVEAGAPSVIYWRVDNLTAGTSASGSVSETPPSSTANLRAGYQIQTVNATTRNIRMGQLYCEVPV